MRINKNLVGLALIIAGVVMMLTGRAMGAVRTMYLPRFGLWQSVSARAESANAARHRQTSAASSHTVIENALPAFKAADITVLDMAVTVSPAAYYGLDMVYPAGRAITWAVEDDKLIIKDEWALSTGAGLFETGGASSNGDAYAIIYCPADVLESLYLETVSGPIAIGGVDVLQMTLKSISGSVYAESGPSSALVAETVSGSIDVCGFGGSDIKLATVSGYINANINAPLTDYRLRCSSVSSTPFINGTAAPRLAGEYTYDPVNPSHTLTANSVSGDVWLMFEDGEN